MEHQGSKKKQRQVTHLHTVIILIPKPDKYITKKENCRPTSLMNFRIIRYAPNLWWLSLQCHRRGNEWCGCNSHPSPPQKTEAQLPDNKSQTPGRCWCKRKGFIQVLHNLGEWWTQRPSYLPAQAPSSYRDREGRASPHPIQLSCYLAC